MKSRRRGGFFGNKDTRQSPEGRTEEAGGPDHYALATAAKKRSHRTLSRARSPWHHCFPAGRELCKATESFPLQLVTKAGKRALETLGLTVKQSLNELI